MLISVIRNQLGRRLGVIMDNRGDERPGGWEGDKPKESGLLFDWGGSQKVEKQMTDLQWGLVRTVGLGLAVTVGCGLSWLANYRLDMLPSIAVGLVAGVLTAAAVNAGVNIWGGAREARVAMDRKNKGFTVKQ